MNLSCNGQAGWGRMNYKLLGKTGLKVSEFCLGTATFGQKEWCAGPAECARIYSYFRDQGGNFIDTANRYAGFKGLIEAI